MQPNTHVAIPALYFLGICLARLKGLSAAPRAISIDNLVRCCDRGRGGGASWRSRSGCTAYSVRVGCVVGIHLVRIPRKHRLIMHVVRTSLACQFLAAFQRFEEMNVDKEVENGGGDGSGGLGVRAIRSLFADKTSTRQHQQQPNYQVAYTATFFMLFLNVLCVVLTSE